MLSKFSICSSRFIGASCWSVLALQLFVGTTSSASIHPPEINKDDSEDTISSRGNSFAPIPFNPPEGRRDNEDDQLGPGGSPRPDCAGLNLPEEVCTAEITALVPWSEVGYFGYTTTNTPTFWVYIPYDASNLTAGAIFELLDPEREPVIPLIQVDLSATPGIIAIPMPPETVLSPGVRYTWYFELQITPNSGSLNPTLIGTVEKVVIDSTILGENHLDRARYFGTEGIWFDALTELMQVQDQYPNILDDFLRQAKLEVIVQGLMKA